MFNSKKFIFTIVMLLITHVGSTADKNEIIISAAASLKDVLTKIKTLYVQENQNVSVILNFGSAGSLQQQIENGAPVDIFISAADKQVAELEKKGLLLEGSRITLVENTVVLVVPKNSELKGDFTVLTGIKVKKIALGEVTSVPIGQYSKEIFDSLGITDAVMKKAVFAKDVRAVLAWVESGNADAGIVYKTDALASKGKVTVIAEAPKGSHRKVIYPAAIIHGTKNSREAGKFLQYLKGKKAEEVFIKYGFITVR